MDVYRILQIKNSSSLLPRRKGDGTFPIFKSSPLLAARATFYQHVLDIKNQVQFDGENGPNLYYTFTRCLRQEALIEWYDIIQPLQTDDDRSPKNFGEDIDTFIHLHDPRDTSELLQDQLNYINHIFKPRHTKPTVFKNQLLRLNNKILLILDADENDKFDDSRIKSIYFSAMPYSGRRNSGNTETNYLRRASTSSLNTSTSIIMTQ